MHSTCTDHLILLDLINLKYLARSTSYEAPDIIFNNKVHCDVILLKYGHQLLNVLYVFTEAVSAMKVVILPLVITSFLITAVIWMTT
jgi:hypothetical protein